MIAKLLNAILSSIQHQRILNFTVRKLTGTHHPDGTWMSLVAEIFGSLPGPDIGSRTDLKYVYIIIGTLNWNCPSEYFTIEDLCGISILTDLLSLH